VRQAFFIIAVVAILVIAGCGNHRRNEAQISGLTPASTTLPKTASIIPADVRLAARDAGIALSAGGYTVTWKYENPGDYSQDGKVVIEDITPIAQHFNEAVSAANEWVDASGDNSIGVADITPVAMNWASEVTGYRIDGADTTNGPWYEIASLTMTDGDASGGRLAFAWEFVPGHIYYRIVTLTPDGDAAFSDTLIAPSNEPIIYNVTPTSGYQHEEYTINATASGQEPLTYAWDFGGGASPNTSSDISPIVTLSDAGEYSASLTISNSYGPTTFPFTLTVNARDMWVHSWGTSANDRGWDFAISPDGYLYLAGTNSFAQVLKANNHGDFIWATEWYGPEGAPAGPIAYNPDGDLIIAGGTSSFGEGHDDLFLLKYTVDGAFLRAMTWGTSDYEAPNDMALDTSGNIYICGYWAVYGGEPLALIVKLDSDWNILWARLWGGTGGDRAYGILAQGDSVYICGETGSFGSTTADAFILKMNSGGEIQWARTWGTDQDDCFYALAAGTEGRIYAIGNSGGYRTLGENVGDILLYSSEGMLQEARSWGLDKYDYFYGVTTRADGDVLVTGASMDGLMLISYSPDLNVISSEAWASEQWSEPKAIACDETGYTYIIGKAKNAMGQWGEIPSEDFAPTGSNTVVSGITSDLVGITHEPTGNETIPDGVVDTGGGGYDILLMKHFIP
jgi:PKD repeat protein